MNRNRLDATYQSSIDPMDTIESVTSSADCSPETNISATDAAGGRPDRRQSPVSSIGQQFRRRAKQPVTHVGSGRHNGNDL